MILMVAEIITEDGNAINLDLRYLKDLEISIFDRQDTSSPSFGLISNSGSLSAIDAFGTLIENVNNKNIKNGTKIELYFKNNLSNYKEKCGVFYVTEMSYDSDNKIINIDFHDALIKLQDVTISIEYDLSVIKRSYTMFQVLEKIREKIKDSSIIFAEIDDDTKFHLKSLKMPFFFIESQSIWSALNSFAHSTQTHIFTNSNGEIEIKYNGGN